MKQQGFTITELMIVVAILGILAAIALPLFGNYTAKAQATEGHEILAGLKSPLVEAISTEGINACDTTKPWFTSSVHTGNFVNGVALEKNETQCLLTVTFKSSGVNDKITDKKINIRYTVGSGVWECGTNVDKELRTASCQGDLLSL